MTTNVESDLIDTIQDKAETWARKLIDLDHRNTLLSFKPGRLGSLDLAQASDAGLTTLFTTRKARLSQLFTAPDQTNRAVAQARVLRKRIVGLEEEQGIDVGRLACGLLVTDSPRSRNSNAPMALRAPLVLYGITMSAMGPGESDFTLELSEDADPNPVLLHALNQIYRLDMDIDAVEDQLAVAIAEIANRHEQVTCTYQILAEIALRQGLSTTLEPCTALGLFSYDKLPMVHDLRESTDLLARSDIVAALADFKPALDRLRERESVDLPDADVIHPKNEFLVQEADSSQQRAINAALAGNNAVIIGPPGTGKSQTIANIIAGAAALGKRVLFVAEKRAAIEAVTQRLADVQLDGLVFDLHHKKISKRQVAQQLAASLDRASREVRPDVDSLHQRLVRLREQATTHPKQLHQLIAPWQLSPYQAQERLLAMNDEASSRIRFRGQTLRVLDESTHDKVVELLRDYINRGGLRIRRRESPWANADIHEEADIGRVLGELDELNARTLSTSKTDMERLVRQTGFPRPTDLSSWQELLGLLDGVSKSVHEFSQEVFGTELDRMVIATGSRKFRARSGVALGFRECYALRKRARSLSTSRLKGSVLHEALALTRTQRDSWQERSGGTSAPVEILGLAEIVGRFAEVRNQLAAVALCVRLGDLTHRPTEEVDAKLEELDADRGTLDHILRINQTTDRLERLGLGALLDDLASRHADADQAVAMFDWAWLNSLVDEFKRQIPGFREFIGKQHNEVVTGFRDADQEHLLMNCRRVRRQVAELVHRADDAYPSQSRTVRKEASKKSRHMPMRKLVEQTADVLLAVHPCWAMSPLVVSRMLPATRLFDLVVFDEASQIEPHDAVTSIMRGDQLVVAGDAKQLPPTRAFQRILLNDQADDDDEAEDSLDQYDSILDVLAPVLPNYQLNWHYRSSDERLIAFANRHIYNGELVTFPGHNAESPLSLELVDGSVAPGQDGIALAEVNRVVELVVEHARTRAHESLGVITFGAKHADAVDRAVHAARQKNPTLESFFSEGKAPAKRFFVKNLERVQGDERDAIILSVGKAKGPTGKISLNFGDLSHEGGERRLNVAITRSKKRMTVVSSFSAYDIQPNATKHIGPELLRQFLEFTGNDQRLDRIGRAKGTALNGFEQSVLNALLNENIEVYPQWGISGYSIDFALAHPQQPGRMVLAVETDGERYHLTPSARDRDRLRQNHLEKNLGWRFHRVWSTDWFRDQAGETARIVASWRAAVMAADREPDSVNEHVPPPVLSEPHEVDRGPRPHIARRDDITEYPQAELVACFRWLLRDQRLLDRNTRLVQAKDELEFQRLGPRMRTILGAALDIAQQQAKKEGN